MAASDYVTVTIKYENGQLIADPPEVLLKAKEDKGIVWEGQGPKVTKYDVCFSESPFDDIYYNQEKKHSSAPNPASLPKKFFRKYFKYSVQVGRDIIDPGVIIW